MKAKQLLKKHNACKEALDWVADRTVEQAWNDCERGDWMLWIYKKLYPNNLRELTLAKGHCANTVRHLMKDQTSIDAVDISIKFGNGEATRGQLDAAAYAYAAAAAAAAADAAADAAAAYAAAADAAKENQKQTADICRKYLTIESGE